jgi:hypothetical protein
VEKKLKNGMIELCDRTDKCTVDNCCGWENPLWTITKGFVMHAEMTI